MRLLVSFAALLAAVALLQLSSGGVGPLDALAGRALGFTRGEVGLLGSAHFAGFFVGCWAAPRLMGSVGHSRAFAACTAAGAIGLIGHTLTHHPHAWAALRVMSGLCVAGCYTVVEAWLHARVTNETRGRVSGAYRAVDLGASLAAQLMIGLLAPLELYLAYNVLAILCCASLLPLTLTTVSPPQMPAAPRLRPALAWARSPLAVIAVMVSGLTVSSFRMIGPLYGTDIGLRPEQVGLFLAAYVGGGAAGQIPIGWIADRRPRRHVLAGLGLASGAACAAIAATAGAGPGAAYAGAFAFGLASFSIYSVAAAHAHDFADGSERVALSAGLLFFYALGAIAAPPIAARLMTQHGPGALFALIAAGNAGLVLFAAARARVRPATSRTAYVYTPRTTLLIGRLLGRAREAGPAASPRRRRRLWRRP